MSIHSPNQHLQHVRAQHGFSLVELMVTVAIALFLLFGLVTIVQNVRQASLDQQSLGQLQDEQRFAMTVLTDVIQAGGYFPDPTAWTLLSSLPATAPFGQGQPFFGAHNAAAPGDTIAIRYRTASGDGVINCIGGSYAAGGTHLYINSFSVSAAGQLQCSLDGAAPVPLVSGVTNLTIYFGVKRSFAISDYNVDTYVTADQMNPADWDNVSSVRVILTFTNPLYKVPGGGQSPTITFDRVVQVMGRAGAVT